MYWSTTLGTPCTAVTVWDVKIGGVRVSLGENGETTVTDMRRLGPRSRLESGTERLAARLPGRVLL